MYGKINYKVMMEKNLNPNQANPYVRALMLSNNGEWIEDSIITEIITRPNDNDPTKLKFQRNIEAAEKIDLKMVSTEVKDRLDQRTYLFVCKLVKHVLIHNTEKYVWDIKRAQKLSRSEGVEDPKLAEALRLSLIKEDHEQDMQRAILESTDASSAPSYKSSKPKGAKRKGL